MQPRMTYGKVADARKYDRFFGALEEGKRCALEPEAQGLSLEILIVEMLTLVPVVASPRRQWVLEATADHDNALVLQNYRFYFSGWGWPRRERTCTIR